MEKLSIIKIGGNVIDNPEELSLFLKDFSNIRGFKILVHGGGKLAAELASKLQIPVVMHQGRRITDSETLKITTMVYAGLINKNIVADLQALEVNSIGISGADGNSIKANKRQNQEIDYGFVGDIEKVNSGFFNLLLNNNLCPIVCAITHDAKGLLLNTNADTIASEIAVGLSESFDVNLIYCFEKDGVLEDVNKPESIIYSLNPEQYKEYKSAGLIHSGMIPKMDNAFDAIKNGVKSVIIGNANNLINLQKEQKNAGTKLSN